MGDDGDRETDGGMNAPLMVKMTGLEVETEPSETEPSEIEMETDLQQSDLHLNHLDLNPLVDHPPYGYRQQQSYSYEYHRQSYSDNYHRQSMKYANLALDYFNKNNHTKYELVKDEVMHSQPIHYGGYFHCNFKAKEDSSSIQEFFAEIDRRSVSGSDLLTICQVIKEDEKHAGCKYCGIQINHPVDGYKVGRPDQYSRETQESTYNPVPPGTFNPNNLFGKIDIAYYSKPDVNSHPYFKAFLGEEASRVIFSTDQSPVSLMWK